MQAEKYVSSPAQVGDQLKTQIASIRPLLIAVFGGLFLLLVSLRVMPVDSTPLLAKVLGLLAPTIAMAGVGAYLGRNIRGWLPLIGLLLVSMVGMFVIQSLGGSDIAIVLMMAWGVGNGMMLGPLVSIAVTEGGPQIIIQALTGTTAVMLLTGFIALATGIDFSFLAPIYLLALFGLIIVGLVGMFVRFSRTGNLIYSLAAMVIFAGGFLFKFFRLSQAENTWEQAVQLTMSLYLTFANFFIYLLQYLLLSRRR
ncbi:MAG: Bax inhibitor-1 family protein [Acidobacteriota bacterium]